MQDWVRAQKRNIRRMSDATLEKELGFARGFAPPTTTLEASWLTELENETRRRSEAVTSRG